MSQRAMKQLAAETADDVIAFDKVIGGTEEASTPKQARKIRDILNGIPPVRQGTGSPATSAELNPRQVLEKSMRRPWHRSPNTKVFQPATDENAGDVRVATTKGSDRITVTAQRGGSVASVQIEAPNVAAALWAPKADGCDNPGHSTIKRHQRMNETPCAACRAWRAGWDANRRPATRKPAECGTESGAARHRRQAEPVCVACKAAEAEARRNRERARRGT